MWLTFILYEQKKLNFYSWICIVNQWKEGLNLRSKTAFSVEKGNGPLTGHSHSWGKTYYTGKLFISFQYKQAIMIPSNLKLFIQVHFDDLKKNKNCNGHLFINHRWKEVVCSKAKKACLNGKKKWSTLL